MVRIKQRADVGHLGHGLLRPRHDLFAHDMRRVGIALEHLQEQAARNSDHGGRLACRRGRGPLGFGRSSMLHTAKVLRLSQDLPVVVEIVDTEEKINAFLPILTELTKSCLITLEKVTVIRYGEDETGLIPERGNTSS